MTKIFEELIERQQRCQNGTVIPGTNRPQTSAEIAFYNEKQLDYITSLTRVTRWRMRKRGEFPNPVHLSPGRVGYPAHLVDEWIEERLNQNSVSV